MKLYFSPGACSLSPHIVLREAGMAFSLEQVDLRSKRTASGADYSAINPKGYVPALETDEGVLLTEGPAIIQFVADRAPGSALAPAAGSMARYQLVEWLNFISTEIHKSFSPLFNPAASEDMKTNARNAINKRYAYLEGILGQRNYLMGEQFSVADVYLFVITNWAGPVQLDLTPYPHVQAFQARIGARPAVQDALRAEGLLQ
ncbi:glutathione transferase GstA [Massilia sp. CF038]|uniref:glutathione transferase GstA n=1 Tax=Massilia sp. CF038 TaxID=1881045 RepID=UPI00092159F3|nr:glutathione transferase GstA [Massilia sp. CF038]SHG37505.1 glutathione S-transferase [Massilia sp. CF038]